MAVLLQTYGPLALALCVGILLAALVDTTSETATAAQVRSGVLQALVWPILIGFVVSAALLLVRVDGSRDASAPHLSVLERWATGDDAGARREKHALTGVPQKVTRTLDRLQARLEREAGEVDRRRETWKEIDGMLGTLDVSMAEEKQAVSDVSRAVEASVALQKSLSLSFDGLSHSADESATSLLEMVAINNEVRDNVHNLSLSVQETTSAIEEMALSSKEVARNIEELSTAAEETAASMNEMDVSISQVETNADETSHLSETVSQDAETGVAAIKQTIEGIDRIKESNRVGADVIGQLGGRISEIGNILNVIDDVAEQTNLLALNAAIIAAQAGEHGRGFAVVADEIKALAERTGASTKEITDLVKTIQDQSRNAIEVMSKGVDDVEEGVRLGRNAEDALRNIVDSAKRSTLMIQAIAHATVEQAKGSKQVTNAISRIAETVQQIALATAEQAKGSEHIMQSADRMRTITQRVERSADEQNRGGQQITQSIESIRETIDELCAAVRHQVDGNDSMASATARVQKSGKRSTEACAGLHNMLDRVAPTLDGPVRPV